MCSDDVRFLLTTTSWLPPELEQKIFEMAAVSRPTEIPGLILVACRVKEWVEPLLYHVIFLCSALASREQHSRTLGLPTLNDALPQIITERPAFLQRAVGHLFLGYSIHPSAVESWLTACTGITNLFAQLTSAPYMHALSALRGVQYLTVDVRAIFEHAATVAPHSSFLAHVTHLELLELVHLSSEDTDRICSHLALIPDLTHVAFNTRLFDNVSHTGLHADARLKCIAFLSARRHALKETSPLLHDSRFVWIQQDSDYRLDWLRGAVTGEDYWAIADAFIAARRLGEVDRSRYCISDTYGRN
ncbi:hypothetical protein B0H13DRAFT_1885138 [Mycena leptocephala]|nr:hypothetical protein B0H13DRAFT_1885138 [Mycena leptocephala]